MSIIMCASNFVFFPHAYSFYFFDNYNELALHVF